MSDIMGKGRDRQEHLGENPWLDDSDGDLPEVTGDEVVGWLEPPSTPMSDSGRSDESNTLSNGSNEASLGRAQPGIPSGGEGRHSLGQPRQSDPHLQFRPTNLVRTGWETGQWVAETYRRFQRKSGSCDTCGLPYVFCRGCSNHEDDMEGALALFGDPRDYSDKDYLDINAIERERDDIQLGRRPTSYLQPRFGPWNLNRDIEHVEDNDLDWSWAKKLTILNVSLARGDEQGLYFYLVR